MPQLTSPEALEQNDREVATTSANLIALGAIAWGTGWKRNQSMVYELSRLEWVRRVVFVNPHEVWIRAEMSAADGSLIDRLRSVSSRGTRRFDEKIQITEMIRFLPLKNAIPIMGRIEEWLFRRRLFRLLRDEPYILLNNHPNFFNRPLLEELAQGAICTAYDISDDFVEYHRDPKDRAVVDHGVRHGCRNADVVLSINDHLRQKYISENANSHVIRNSTNYSNFARSEYRPVPELEELRARGGPIIGYTGIINSIRVDYELLKSVIRARPEWNYVFVGSADKSFEDLAGRFPQIFYRPAVDYTVLPDYVAYFDAAMVPFRLNEHTRGNDLLKFNDYLAMGLGIVTTNTGGAERYGDLLRIASSGKDFVSKLEDVLKEQSPELQRRRREFAKQNSWSNRVLEIESIIQDHLVHTRRPAQVPES